MKIVTIKSHVLEHPLEQELGYSQQYYQKRTAHLVEVTTSDGVTGWGECFGPGNVARANRTIVEEVVAPLVIGSDPFDRERLWHGVYNLTRDHGQKGMVIQALSGVDIALWDIAGKVLNVPLVTLLGGRCRDGVPVYGYGMMLRRVDDLAARFAAEAEALEASGFSALKMKIGLGPHEDIKLVEAVRHALSDSVALMVDANHAYATLDALAVGRALDRLSVAWFEEPVAPEDHAGYRHLRQSLQVPIAGGEAEFTRWGWKSLLESQGLDIAQPEVCGLGGITEYQKVLALAHAHFTPVVNHVWGTAISVAVNLHLLAAMPDLPGSLYPRLPMLEFDTTPNPFRDELAEEPLNIAAAVARGATVAPPSGPGIGVTPDRGFIQRYNIS